LPLCLPCVFRGGYNERRTAGMTASRMTRKARAVNRLRMCSVSSKRVQTRLGHRLHVVQPTVGTSAKWAYQCGVV
jgi:hypothetical protein